MTTVIATGCPHSNWERALPILQLAGLEPVGDSFSQCYDELFRPGVMIEAPMTDYLLQEPKSERAMMLL